MRKDVFENLGELASAVELDHEVQLARSELYKLAKYAIKLHNMLKNASEEQGLEGWVSAEITKSAEGISKVYHSLEYEMKVGKDSSEDLGGMGPKEPEMPFEGYKNTLGQKLTEHLKKKIVEGPKSGVRKQPANQANYFQQQRSGGAKKKPANQANYFQQQRSGGVTQKPAAKPATPAAPAAQQANFAQGGGGAAPAAKPATPAAKPATPAAPAAKSSTDAGFNPTHFHKGNLGNTIPLQHKDGKWYWQKDGKVEQWYGDVNNRGYFGSASVDGEIKNGKEVAYGDDETFASRQKGAAEPTAQAPAASTTSSQVTPKGGANTAQAMATTADSPGQSAGNKRMQQNAKPGDRAQGFQPSTKGRETKPNDIFSAQRITSGAKKLGQQPDGTYKPPPKAPKKFSISNYDASVQLPLTPNVTFRGRQSLEFGGEKYRFAGPTAEPPSVGVDISIPSKNQMRGGVNYRGKGWPVRLSGGMYYRLT